MFHLYLSRGYPFPVLYASGIEAQCLGKFIQEALSVLYARPIALGSILCLCHLARQHQTKKRNLLVKGQAGAGRRTCEDGLVSFPVLNDIVPREIRSEPKERGQLWLFASEKVAMMFEADYVSSLGVPSLCKLCCGWYGSEPYTIWPEREGGR